MELMVGVTAMLALATLCGCLAGFASWACAYDRAFPTRGRREARRLAKRAIPFPFAYFFVLAVIVNFVTPFFIDLG